MNDRYSWITEKLTSVLARNLPTPPLPDGFPLDRELSLMGLDSMSAVNLLLDLETDFEITFPDHMLTREIFYSGETLREAILNLTGPNNGTERI